MKKVTISCAIADAVIRYTLDGNDPTESSQQYTAPFLVEEGKELRARAFKTGYRPSNVIRQEIQ